MTTALPETRSPRTGVASPELPITAVEAAAYRFPTDRPEADGTLSWDATTLVLARLTAGDQAGLGYTYTDAAAARIITGVLADAVRGIDVMDVPRIYATMRAAVRNIGATGVVAAAISAVDVAAWDAKAVALGLPLAALLGRAHDAIPGYGSGGFTSYTNAELTSQLTGWVEEQGFGRVKMKVGSDADADPARVALARRAIGPSVELFVDGNGAYDRKQALDLADAFAERNVRWFEEPVPQHDIAGLRLIRDRAPAGMQVAAGEYGYAERDFLALLDAGAVDVLQADATRCGGATGFLEAAALAAAHRIPLSTHTAPALHTTLACAAAPAIHLEWFYDHARIEAMAFDEAPVPDAGLLRPRLDRPGLGLVLRERDIARYAVEGWA